MYINQKKFGLYENDENKRIERKLIDGAVTSEKGKFYDASVTRYPNGQLELVKHEKVLRRPNWGNGKRKDTDEAEIMLSRKSYARRIKKRILEYGLANDWEQFWTLTFAPEQVPSRYDYDDLSVKIQKFFRFLRDKYGKFQYLVVPEFHKDGAIHFHAIVSGFSGILAMQTRQSNPEQPAYSLLDWDARYGNPGQQVASKVLMITNDDGGIKTAKYLSKYLDKSLTNSPTIALKNKKMYFVSRGLKKPEKILTVFVEPDDIGMTEDNKVVTFIKKILYTDGDGIEREFEDRISIYNNHYIKKKEKKQDEDVGAVQ